MSQIRQSLCLPPFVLCGATHSDLIRVAAETGYEAVEVWGREDDFAEIVGQAHAGGLTVASMVGHWSHEQGLNDRTHHDRIEDELRESIEIAAAKEIPGVIVLSGNRRPGLSDEEAVEITLEGLRRVIPLAEEKGVDLNLELLNSKVDHPDYHADNTAWGVQVVRAADSERVRLLYDIYHMQIMEGDVIRTITDHIDQIGHFHTAGVPDRHDIGGSQELHYPAVARAIAATDYKGFVAHEFWPEGDPLEAVKTAFEICA